MQRQATLIFLILRFNDSQISHKLNCTENQKLTQRIKKFDKSERIAYLLSNGDRLGRGVVVVIVGFGVGEKVIEVVDDGDVERAARAPSDLFAEFELILGALSRSHGETLQQQSEAQGLPGRGPRTTESNGCR